ncbi:MAG TPA: GNAT family N-acetyltransferase [Chryseolinea sp.]|nr:GNAT family N-acetyltransferase [Chryseolinea sp.]
METEVHSKGTVSVRLATPGDVSLLIELGVQTFYDTFAEVNTKSDMDLYLQKNFDEAQVASELNDADNTFFIAESNGTAAGYAKLRKGAIPAELVSRNAIELERLYAGRAFIGKNVGKVLMERCFSLAKEQRFATVWLGVWEHNHRAIAFYRKCGFEKFGTHPFTLGTDLQTDHMMKKDIS